MALATYLLTWLNMCCISLKKKSASRRKGPRCPGFREQKAFPCRGGSSLGLLRPRVGLPVGVDNKGLFSDGAALGDGDYSPHFPREKRRLREEGGHVILSSFRFQSEQGVLLQDLNP